MLANLAAHKSGVLGSLPRLRDTRTRRVSSWDRTGGNDDRLKIQPGETATLAKIEGAGCINHLWCTMACDEETFLRKVVLRMYWDDEPEPSVEAPIGDFFGVGHALTANFWSLPLAMGPEDGRAFNCFFPMPFAQNARIEVTSECSRQVVYFYYYVDYEVYDGLEEGLGRFHAQWRRENPCQGIDEAALSNEDFEFGGTNTTGDDNYVILEAEGQGHYVGCNLNIHNLRQTEQWNWYGEGDDMIFIDGEPFPPSVHGTGTEDYFSMAYCPSRLTARRITGWCCLVDPTGPARSPCTASTSKTRSVSRSRFELLSNTGMLIAGPTITPARPIGTRPSPISDFE